MFKKIKTKGKENKKERKNNGRYSKDDDMNDDELNKPPNFRNDRQKNSKSNK